MTRPARCEVDSEQASTDTPGLEIGFPGIKRDIDASSNLENAECMDQEDGDDASTADNLSGLVVVATDRYGVDIVDDLTHSDYEDNDDEEAQQHGGKVETTDLSSGFSTNSGLIDTSHGISSKDKIFTKLVILALIVAGLLVVLLVGFVVLNGKSGGPSSVSETIRSAPSAQPLKQPPDTPARSSSNKPSPSPNTVRPTMIPASSLPISMEFVLINTVTGRTITSLGDGYLIDVADLGLELTIEARLSHHDDETSVAFYFDNELVRIDTKNPFYLTSEHAGSANPFPAISEIGNHTLRVTVSSTGDSVSGENMSVTITVVDSNTTSVPVQAPAAADGGSTATSRPTQSPTVAVATVAPTMTPTMAETSTTVDKPVQQNLLSDSVFTGFTLIDADSDVEIMPVYDGDEIDLNALGTFNLNLRVEVNPSNASTVEEVSFTYGQDGTRTERTPPFAIGGNTLGDYSALSWLTTPGVKVVTAAASVSGRDEVDVYTIQFSVTDGKGTAPIEPAPIPAPVAPPASAPVVPTHQISEESGDVIITGEMRKWHKITLAFQRGPQTSETATPNPFTDYRLDVVFINGDMTMTVPGYYAADGKAADTSADSGSVWHCHFRPPATGEWTWQAFMYEGSNVISQRPGQVSGTPIAFHGLSGSFNINSTNKSGRDLRGKGLLRYVDGKHHLQFTETGEWFLKTGTDSPENFLAYEDFDNTPNNRGRRKDWAPHVQDFQDGDPTWQGQKGRGIIGAVNYLSDQGLQAFSFLTMNIQGDDQNVFPYVQDSDRLRIDVSKTAQWDIVFEHATEKGMYLHFKTQETENDSLLDNGEFFGVERKLYYRELIARFGHHLALNWNLGEENNNSSEQLKAFSDWFKALDPYQHIVVVHTNIGRQNDVYGPLLGYPTFNGASIQTQAEDVFRDTLNWVEQSAAAGRPWIVANDEQGNAQIGVLPDTDDPEHNDIRRDVLWGNIMAGGAGVEYYFGYSYDNSDMTCEDFRSRANMWVQSKHALDFFSANNVPFQNMSNDNNRVNNDNWCLVGLEDNNQEPVIVVYLRNGGTADVDLTGVESSTSGSLSVQWYDPRNGGALQSGSVGSLQLGQGSQSLGNAPNDSDRDWIVLLR